MFSSPVFLLSKLHAIGDILFQTEVKKFMKPSSAAIHTCRKSLWMGKNTPLKEANLCNPRCCRPTPTYPFAHAKSPETAHRLKYFLYLPCLRFLVGVSSAEKTSRPLAAAHSRWSPPRSLTYPFAILKLVQIVLHLQHKPGKLTHPNDKNYSRANRKKLPHFQQPIVTSFTEGLCSSTILLRTMLSTYTSRKCCP